MENLIYLVRKLFHQTGVRNSILLFKGHHVSAITRRQEKNYLFNFCFANEESKLIQRRSQSCFFLVQLLLILLGACHENMKAWCKGVLLIHVLIPLLSLSNIVQPTKQSNAHWFSLHFMISYTDSKAITTLWNVTNNTTRHRKKVMLRRFFQENDAMLLRRLYP